MLIRGRTCASVLAVLGEVILRATTALACLAQGPALLLEAQVERREAAQASGDVADPEDAAGLEAVAGGQVSAAGVREDQAASSVTGRSGATRFAAKPRSS